MGYPVLVYVLVSVSLILLCHFCRCTQMQVFRVGNRLVRVSFTLEIDPTEAISVSIMSQPDPGILRSVLAEIQTDPTAYCEQLNPNRPEKNSGTRSVHSVRRETLQIIGIVIRFPFHLYP